MKEMIKNMNDNVCARAHACDFKGNNFLYIVKSLHCFYLPLQLCASY